MRNRFPSSQGPADELQADGQAELAEAAGHGDGREPRGVHGAGVARNVAGTGTAHLLTATLRFEGVGVDARRRQRRGGSHEEIHILENAGVFLLDDALDLHRLGVVAAQHELAGQSAVERIGPVILTVGGDVRLVGHHAVRHAGEAQRAGVLHAGYADLAGGDSQFFQGGDGAANGGFHLRIQVVEVVVGGDAHGEPAEPALHDQRIVINREPEPCWDQAGRSRRWLAIPGRCRARSGSSGRCGRR